MEIGIVGVGRMGKELAARLAVQHRITIYDTDTEKAAYVSREYGAMQADSLWAMTVLPVVILAVPDKVVGDCLKVFNEFGSPVKIINIATNVSSHLLEKLTLAPLECINVKFISQATEMAIGQKPVIIINDQPEELVALAEEIFRHMGHVIVGRADMVAAINSIATESALVAAVCIEENLYRQGIDDKIIIQSAIRQVAAGVLKAFADHDLGPYARDVVLAVRAKLHKDSPLSRY